jgi:hypothetical protein
VRRPPRGSRPEDVDRVRYTSEVPDPDDDEKAEQQRLEEYGDLKLR